MIERAREVAEVLGGLRDVLAGRVTEPEPPAWARERGWVEPLRALSTESLERCEAEGLAVVAGDLALPEDLRALAATVRRLTDVPAPVPSGEDAVELRRASPRKREQVASLVRMCRSAPRPARVLDVGAGHGHLTRELARALEVPCVGVERDPERVEVARGLAATLPVTYRTLEADAEALEVGPDDLVVGLHACGALGDALVEATARGGASLLLVNCCLQKVPGVERAPLSDYGRQAGLTVPREVLGLTNLLSRAQGVESDVRAIMADRTRRYALRCLLLARGLALEPGAEMRGLHRRHARRGTAAMAERALARRGLAPPTVEEVTEAEARAAREHGVMRRLSLPRNMLGRLLELAVVLDRAHALEAAGHEVSVAAVFPAHLSPRNVGIFARRA